MNAQTNVSAAVATGCGIGAISTIELVGTGAKDIIKSIFTSYRQKNAFKLNSITVGQITDAENIIDQAAVGCENENQFAIHCHGNPLLVEVTMEILQRKGVKLVSYESLIEMKAMTENKTSIEAESIIGLTKCKSLKGIKLIQHQISDGLLPAILKWQSEENVQIRKEAEKIVANSNHARLLLDGCKVVICGPPNSGKSTLFNQFCGRQKAIVTDMKGTTRDWISADISFNSINFEVYDTAGIDTDIIQSYIDSESQNKTIELAKKSDIILLVLDSNTKENVFDVKLLKTLTAKRVIAVMNKCDLPQHINQDFLNVFANRVKISSKTGKGIDNLLKKLLHVTGIDRFDIRQTAAFTGRQIKLLSRIAGSDNPDRVKTYINELLCGRLCV